MSTCLNDYPSAVQTAAGLNPATLTGATNGPAVELAGDGPCFAVQMVGEASEDFILTGRIEQSADGSSWATLAGATFTAVGLANNLQVIRFTPTARYVRWACTLTGDPASATVGVVIGRQKKTL